MGWLTLWVVTITVLVPDELGMTELSKVDGVRPLRYDLDQPLPDGYADATVLVPGFLTGNRPVELLPKLPRLEYVQLLTAGAEAWIDQVPAGVLLSTCRGAHSVSTAELVLGGLITLYRDLWEFAASQRAGKWERRVTDTLQGRRALIIGAGDVGDAIARALRVFDVSTAMVGRTARDGVHGVADVPGLLGDVDIVVLVVPLTSQTTGLVDAAFLARMPDGAVLVNAARGPVVHTGALLAELESGRLRAVLDVTDPEPLPADHPLWTAPGLVLFPHQGGTCRAQFDRAWAIAAGEIGRFARGEKPHNAVRGEY